MPREKGEVAFPDAVGLQLSAQVGSSLSFLALLNHQLGPLCFQGRSLKSGWGTWGPGFPAPGLSFPGTMTHLRTLAFGGLKNGYASHLQLLLPVDVVRPCWRLCRAGGHKGHCVLLSLIVVTCTR